MSVEHLYFAYGSNLDPARLRERVGEVRIVGPARAPGRRLVCNKLGRDGSGKANLVVEPGAEVWGVVYRLSPAAWPILDRWEAGYRRICMPVVVAEDAGCLAQTYVSLRLVDDPTPFDWYKRLLVEGARAHGLPDRWLEQLGAIPSRPDPRRGP